MNPQFLGITVCEHQHLSNFFLQSGVTKLTVHIITVVRTFTIDLCAQECDGLRSACLPGSPSPTTPRSGQRRSLKAGTPLVLACSYISSAPSFVRFCSCDHQSQFRCILLCFVSPTMFLNLLTLNLNIFIFSTACLSRDCSISISPFSTACSFRDEEHELSGRLFRDEEPACSLLGCTIKD